MACGFSSILTIYFGTNARWQVIQEVRKSVLAIPTLEPMYREQVIDSYAASLRATFIMAACLAVFAIALTLPLRLPLLGHRKPT